MGFGAVAVDVAGMCCCGVMVGWRGAVAEEAAAVDVFEGWECLRGHR